jgi:hypothetical protein
MSTVQTMPGATSLVDYPTESLKGLGGTKVASVGTLGQISELRGVLGLLSKIPGAIAYFGKMAKTLKRPELILAAIMVAVVDRNNVAGPKNETEAMLSTRLAGIDTALLTKFVKYADKVHLSMDQISLLFKGAKPANAESAMKLMMQLGTTTAWRKNAQTVRRALAEFERLLPAGVGLGAALSAAVNPSREQLRPGVGGAITPFQRKSAAGGCLMSVQANLAFPIIGHPRAAALLQSVGFDPRVTTVKATVVNLSPVGSAELTTQITNSQGQPMVPVVIPGESQVSIQQDVMKGNQLAITGTCNSGTIPATIMQRVPVGNDIHDFIKSGNQLFITPRQITP